MKVIHQAGFSMHNTAVALGHFDGLHRGHMSVIDRVLQAAPQGLTPCVFTFSREDASFKSNAPALMTPSSMECILRKKGVAVLIAPPFETVRRWSPEKFVTDFLIGQLGAKLVVCGFNYHFGQHAHGDPALLQTLCKEHGVQVQVVPPVLEDGLPVSSTRIRSLLLEGNLPEASKLLGRPFYFDMKVVTGRQVGRLMGTPTMNQHPPEGFLIPPKGVYASCSYVEGQWLPSVTNCGYNPTVGTLPRPVFETWIPRYDGDLYDQHIPVALLKFLRPECKFPSLDALRTRIVQDGEDATRIVQESNIDFSI